MTLIREILFALKQGNFRGELQGEIKRVRQM